MREVFAERKNATERRGHGHGSQLSEKASKAPFLRMRGTRGARSTVPGRQPSSGLSEQPAPIQSKRADLQDGWFPQRKKKAGLAVVMLDVVGLLEKCSERLLEVVGWISN